MSQLQLRLEAPDYLQSKFEDFDARHPEVYEAFKRAAHALRDAGRRRFGTAAIYEHLRWSTSVRDDKGPFKLDNSFRSRLARKLLGEDPSFEGFLEVRKLRFER